MCVGCCRVFVACVKQCVLASIPHIVSWFDFGRRLDTLRRAEMRVGVLTGRTRQGCAVRQPNRRLSWAKKKTRLNDAT